jgi:adenine modification enzyme
MTEIKGFIYSPQLSIDNKRQIIGFGDKAFCVRYIDRAIANKLIIENHYAGTIVSAGRYYFGVFMDGNLCGVLQFGFMMNPQSGKSIVSGATIDNVLELNRMWLAESAPRNSESTALSYAIRIIRNVDKRVKFIQSFADERCGRFGVVYQAANFDYFGEHKTDFYELDGEWFHSKMTNDTTKIGTPRYEKITRSIDKANKHTLRQFRYIYFIDKSWRSRCLLKQQPYPKNDA